MSKDNLNLHKAKKTQNDEFYTQYSDIENEMIHYTEYFKNKVIYCNCDNPKISNFWNYFHKNFSKLKLKKLICTYYQPDGRSYKTEYKGGNDLDITLGDECHLIDNGSFESREAIKLLKESDIIITNPPFSLFRDFISLLMKFNKDFLIIGSMNAISYKDFFPLIKHNKLWMGYSYPNKFIKPDGNVKIFGNICWYTNLPVLKRNEFIPLTKTYSPDKYPKYDNYDAINIDKVSDIPKDYYKEMGVPISFLNKYNPKQFEIISLGTAPDFFKPKIIYKKILRHNRDGTVTKKHICCNQVLTIGYETLPDGIYFTAENTDKYLVTPYKRILIKRKYLN